MRRALIVMGMMVPLGLMLRAVGPAPLFALLPHLRVRLAYRRLGANHGMLERPAMRGYRRLVGDPTGRL